MIQKAYQMLHLQLEGILYFIEQLKSNNQRSEGDHE